MIDLEAIKAHKPLRFVEDGDGLYVVTEDLPDRGHPVGYDISACDQSDVDSLLLQANAFPALIAEVERLREELRVEREACDEAVRILRARAEQIEKGEL